MQKQRKPNGPADVADAKRAAKERDGWKCVECGMTNEAHVEKHGRGLEAHRVVPGSLYTLDGLRTLCLGCHQSKPQRAPKQPDLGDPRRNQFCVLRIPDDVYDQLAELARQDMRSVNQLTVILIKETLAARAEKPAPGA